jgi:hypothetical protein
MIGKIAVVQKSWDQAIDAVQQASAITNIAKLPRYSEALSLLYIDALMQRNLTGDREAVHDLIISLPDSTAEGTVAFSDCVELARARDAARLRLPAANPLLRRALNALEKHAYLALSEADRAFARLADAAAEVGDTVVAHQARGRSKYYRFRRLAASGAAWGGDAHAAL